jgi:hypothetical protein
MAFAAIRERVPLEALRCVFQHPGIAFYPGTAIPF